MPSTRRGRWSSGGEQHLNFQGQTEEAVNFYAEVFGTEITMLSPFSDMPDLGPSELPAEERALVLHAELPILAGHVLMATDMLRSLGQETRVGNTTICLDVISPVCRARSPTRRCSSPPARSPGYRARAA